MEARRPSVGRVLELAGVGALLAVGVVAVAACAWALIPNHVLAVFSIVVLVPLFLWGVFNGQDF